MKRPNPGTIQAKVLDLLKRGPLTLNAGRKELNLADKQFRGAIDRLRFNGWEICCSGPSEWRLATRGHKTGSTG
jgi:hypothetical protein